MALTHMILKSQSASVQQRVFSNADHDIPLEISLKTQMQVSATLITMLGCVVGTYIEGFRGRAALAAVSPLAGEGFLGNLLLLNRLDGCLARSRGLMLRRRRDTDGGRRSVVRRHIW